MDSAGFTTINPTNGEQLERFAFFGPSETEAVLARSATEFRSFRRWPEGAFYGILSREVEIGRHVVLRPRAGPADLPQSGQA
jgi:hypothetical protein